MGQRRRFCAAGSFFLLVAYDGVTWIALDDPVRGIVRLYLGLVYSIVLFAFMSDDGETERLSSR